MWPEEETLQRMYRCAYCLHPNDDVALRIVLEACDIIPHAQRAQGRRPSSLRSYKQIIPFEGLPQVSVSIASERWERDQESRTRKIQFNNHYPTFEDKLVRYINFLAWKTMTWNSCHVAVGLGCLLYNYRPNQIEKVAPDVVDNPRRVKHQLICLLKERFPCLNIVSDGSVNEKTVTRAPNDDKEREIIKKSLEVFAPWWIPHQSSDLILRFFDNNNPKFEWKRIHAFLCPICDGLANLVQEYNKIFSSESHMKLNYPDEKLGVPDFHGGNGSSSGNSSTPNRFDPPVLQDREIMLIQRGLQQNQNRREKYQTGSLRVYIDGKELLEFDPRENARQSLDFTTIASHVQIFGKDQEGEILLAVFPLPRLKLAQGECVKESIKLESGQRLKIAIEPIIGNDEEGKGRIQIIYSEPSLTAFLERIGQAAAVVIAPLLSSLTAIQKKIESEHPPFAVNAFPDGKSWRNWRGAALIQAAVITFLLIIMFFQYQQNTLRVQTASLINQEFRDAAQFLTLIKRAPTNDLTNAAQQIRVIPAVAGDMTYPYLVWGNQPNVATIAEGLQKFPDLEALHWQCLKQWSEIFIESGDILVQTGKINDAIFVFEFLTKDPHDKALLYGLAELYKMDLRHQDAIAIYEDMIARSWAENDPRPWHYAGFSYEELGDFEKALKYYDQALNIFPNYAKVFYNKAQIYLKLPGLSPQEKERLYKENFQMALELTLKAYEKDDNNPRIPFTLAILYAVQRDWGHSLSYLESAMQRDRTYVVRAEKERALAIFQDRLNEPYYSQFANLLGRYRPVQGKFSAELRGEFNPTIFLE